MRNEASHLRTVRCRRAGVALSDDAILRRQSGLQSDVEAVGDLRQRRPVLLVAVRHEKVQLRVMEQSCFIKVGHLRVCKQSKRGWEPQIFY